MVKLVFYIQLEDKLVVVSAPSWWKKGTEIKLGVPNVANYICIGEL